MPVTEPATQEDVQPRVSGEQSVQLDLHPGEQRFRAISRAVPSFGGYFFDEGGNLVAYLVDLNEEATAQAHLEPVLRRRRVSAHQVIAAEPRVLIRQGLYSFFQLHEWRDRAVDEVLGLGDVVWIDLDEARNRLAIGLETGSGQADIEERLADLAIPLDAVVFEVTGSIVLEAKKLYEYVRPLVGGLQINMRAQDTITFGPCNAHTGSG